MKLLLIILLLGLTACNSAWDKDPFASDPSGVQNAVPQGANKPTTPPLQSVVFIKLDPFYELKEGRKIIIETGYTLTHPEFKFIDFKIIDLEETFPGAVFDPATMTIEWTPPDGYVPNSAIVYRNPLVIAVFVEYKGLIQEVRKSASINVLRGDARAPYIKEVTGFKNVKEGEQVDFKVIVEDEVSPRGPTLAVRNQYTIFSGNGAGFIRHDVTGVQDKNDPSLWIFDGIIDLTKTTEITTDYQNFNIAFTAHSSFGESSQIYSESFYALTNIVKPEFYIQKSSRPTFKKDVLNTYTFTIVDPRREGEVQGEFVTDCSKDGIGGADCFCNNFDFYASCTINWVPKATGIFDFKVKGINKIDKLFVQDSKEKTETIQIEVTE